MALLPIEVDFSSSNVKLNPPLDSYINVKKGIASFLLLMKPHFEIADIIRGCGNALCDSGHSTNLDKECPALIGDDYNNHVMTTYFKIGESNYIFYCSRKLAEYFLHPSIDKVRNKKKCDLYLKWYV